MRFLKWLVGIVVVLILAAWFGGETVLTNQARQMIENDPGMSAASVAPMRSATRVGMVLTDLQIEDGGLSLPKLDLWVPPWAPTEFHIALPPQFSIAPEGVPVAVAAQAATASAHFAPTASLALSQLRADSGAVEVNGAPQLDHLSLRADLKQIGANAPDLARAGYEAQIDVAGLRLPPIPDLPEIGPVSLAGPAFIWLTEAPAQGILSGRGTDPQLAGVESREGLELSFGALKARIAGRITADAQGFAEGTVLLYTRDAEGFIGLAQQAGILPERGAAIARAALSNMSQAPLPVGNWPAPEAGEVQLALQMRSGRIFLGPLPLTPALQLMQP